MLVNMVTMGIRDSTTSAIRKNSRIRFAGLAKKAFIRYRRGSRLRSRCIVDMRYASLKKRGQRKPLPRRIELFYLLTRTLMKR